MQRRIFFVLGSFLLSACGLTKEFTHDNASSVAVSNDESELEERIFIYDDPGEVALDTEVDGAMVFAASSNPVRLELVAEVDAPIVNGNQVQATDVLMSAGKAFVAYSQVGDPTRGAMDIINIRQETNPRMRSEVLLPFMDVNALHLKRPYVYFTGASDLQDLGGAYVGRIRLSASKFKSELITQPLESLAGNDVFVTNADVLVSSGDVGGVLSVFSRSLVPQFQLTLENIVSVAARRSSEVYALQSETADLFQFNLKDVRTNGQSLSAVAERRIDLEGLSIAESKARVFIGFRQFALVSLGDGGWSMVCRKDGNVLHNEPTVDPGNELAVTNAVAIYNGLIFASNGEAGVYAYSMKASGGRDGRCRNLSAAFLGKLTLEGNPSVNHVALRGKNLFVATTEGLKILRLIRDDEDEDDEDNIDDFDDDEDEDDEDDD